MVRVSGLVGGKNFTVFRPDVHFRLGNNRIIWLHATEKPLDGGRLEVEYTYREPPAGLTDFNPGSVVGTLVRAVARELKLLYEQMDQAYRRAFIDEANGAALDNVVALLNVTRNPALKARGEVTFFRKSATNRNVPIPAGTRIEDASRRAFVTTKAAQIEPVITETSRLVDDGVTVKNQIAAKKKAPDIEGIWRKLPNSDQVSGDPIVAPDTPGMQLSDDKRTILFQAVAQPRARRAGGARGHCWCATSRSASPCRSRLWRRGRRATSTAARWSSCPRRRPVWTGWSTRRRSSAGKARRATSSCVTAPNMPWSARAMPRSTLSSSPCWTSTASKAWKWSITASTARFPSAKCVCAIRAAMMARCSK